MLNREEILIIKTPEQKIAHKAYVNSLKREKIREGIEKTICSCCDNPSFYGKTITLKDCQDICREKAICAYCTDLRDALLKCESDLGVVIKVDRELPNYSLLSGQGLFKEKVEELGLVAVESLIE